MRVKELLDASKSSFFKISQNNFKQKSCFKLFGIVKYTQKGDKTHENIKSNRFWI